MPEYDYIKFTSTSPRFVRSQSFHHHHRPRQHARTGTRCREDCACVSVEDWNDMVERERSARSTNESLARDNRTLKADLRAVYADNQRLQSAKRELQDEVDALRRDDDVVSKFRRRMAALKAELDGKDLALQQLSKDKELADIRVRELSQTVSDQGAEIAKLEDDNALLKKIHKRDQHNLGVQTEKTNEAWSMVSELQRRLSDCRPFRFRPRYSFT
ncbi:hypothetical protein F5Y01DRAFT_278870 [Xylaria sp. FL0043]|nr:hypothetical protein F5Y01DRAFT_278870 [Xylaria sp. FL0043]